MARKDNPVGAPLAAPKRAGQALPLRAFQPREPYQELLRPDRVEPDDHLLPVPQSLDLPDGADPELAVPHPHADGNPFGLLRHQLHLVEVRRQLHLEYCVKVVACGFFAPRSPLLVPASSEAEAGLEFLLNIEELPGDVGDKAGGGVVLLLAEDPPPPGVGEEEPLPGPGHSYVAEAALLLHLGGVVQGADVGKEALLHADHEHYGELQPLG